MSEESRTNTPRRAALLISLAILGPLATIIQVIYAPRHAKDVLAALGVFISCPYVLLVLTVFVLLLLRGPIERLVDRLVSWGTPAGKMAFTHQATPDPAIAPADPGQQERAQVSDEMLDIPKEKFFNGIAYVLEYVERARQWRFHYLSFFLIPNSKLVLRWFLRAPSFPLSRFHSEWGGAIRNIGERQAILNALVTYRLIEEADGEFRATEDGRDFVEFIEQNGGWIRGIPAPPRLMERPKPSHEEGDA